MRLQRRWKRRRKQYAAAETAALATDSEDGGGGGVLGVTAAVGCQSASWGDTANVVFFISTANCSVVAITIADEVIKVRRGNSDSGATTHHQLR